MAKVPACNVVDFETHAILERPQYPPVPVGVSIQKPGERGPRYYAWGHRNGGNNCDKRAGQRALQEVWRSGVPILCHHAKFDLDVAEVHMDLQLPPWEQVHDTELLIFLTDPHAMLLGLKPAAQRILGMKPEERDAVREWLVQAGIVKKTQKDWGAHIADAPGDVVGPYANGDVTRTKKLFQKCYQEICARGMLQAYQRELQIMPILLRSEREGIKVDQKKLRTDMEQYVGNIEKADNWLRKRLKAPSLNVDSNDELAEALERAGIVTEFTITKTGKKSTSKKNLHPGMYKDRKVAGAVGYRSRASTCVGTFGFPWLRMAEASNGIIYTNWNQVRQTRGDGGKNKGTRTGRLSSNPNFQNIPTDFDLKDDGYAHPDFLDVQPLPLMRKYLLPDRGGLWLKRDYSQQELRILAHFEDGALMQAYHANPGLDIHDFVRQKILELLGLDLQRRYIKTVNFATIYGEGVASLAEKMGISFEEAKRIKDAQRAVLPGVKELEKALKQRGKEGFPIRTWGGREYYAEEPRIINGFVQEFYYKLLNYLIQGSAADCTKQAMIYYDQARKDGRFLAQVHDELNITAPRGAAKNEMRILRECMEEVKFDVLMLTDGETGTNWGTLTKYKDLRMAA